VAAKHPGLVKEIVLAGHELASHGSWHRMISKQTREEFKTDLVASKILLEDISGKEVNIYRAPSWSISADTLWALEVLEEEGFVCDSSIQPFATHISGIKGAPVIPYHPVIGGRQLKLVEFPPTVLEIGSLRVPFSGGFYFRAMPSFLFNLAMRRVNQNQEGMVYIHPWELDIKQPRHRVSPLIWLSHYLNIERTKEKLEKLFNRFDFVTLGDLINDGEYPALPVIKKCVEKK
jgi:polysaccharide deacetylase family protein (PEP-CTERM system associated)